MIRVHEVDAKVALQASYMMTKDMYSAIGRAVSHLKNTGVKKEDLGGPVAIYNETQRAVERSEKTKDWGFLIQWIAFFSINLGFMNLLPIPLLDGGHIMLSSYEWITRKRISMAVRGRLHFVGLLFVCALMAFAIYSDIARLAG
jgi:regulator of sigma E protease